ncbi:MAG: prolipoprotein diacylglyceryl transferase family protein, partial [Bryocella sp.]
FVTLAGIVGAKAWHELENPAQIAAAIHMEIVESGGSTLMGVLHWFQAGFAWFGGLLAGIATLLWQGHVSRFKGPREGVPGQRVGGVRMLDLAAPAAAIGYGVGRIGCLTSGDGDYGIPTTLPWGVHMANGTDMYHRALVPTAALVQPTPVYELLFGLVVFWILWKLGKSAKPIGWLTGLYLVLSGIGRFLVEFVRINPRLYFHHTMSNAQVAAMISALVGVAVMVAAWRVNKPWTPVMRTE